MMITGDVRSQWSFSSFFKWPFSMLFPSTRAPMQPPLPSTAPWGSTGANTCRVATKMWAIGMNALAVEAIQEGKCLWKIRPRLDHIFYDHAWRLHPLWIACYADEYMVGKIKSMAVEAMPRQMARQALIRYTSYTCSRWYRQLLGEWIEPKKGAHNF